MMPSMKDAEVAMKLALVGELLLEPQTSDLLNYHSYMYMYK